MEQMKHYVKDRDEMLLKRSVEEFRKFVAKYEKYYSPMFVDAIVRADDKVLEITMHKMIVHCTNLPFDFRQESADWLLDRGFHLELGESEVDAE